MRFKVFGLTSVMLFLFHSGFSAFFLIKIMIMKQEFILGTKLVLVAKLFLYRKSIMTFCLMLVDVRPRMVILFDVVCLFHSYRVRFTHYCKD